MDTTVDFVEEDLKDYVCTKKVKAKPMKYHEAGVLGLIRDYDRDRENEHGYVVVYSDSYKSWSPQDAFEEGYVLNS
jgi:hypothetical protein